MRAAPAPIRLRHLLPAGLAALLTACGDGLVDDRYPGEPVLTISGQVRSETTQDFPDAPLNVAILWEIHTPGDFSYQPPLEVTTTFPARYRLSLYEAPPDAVWLDSADGGRFAMAAVVLYLDESGDGRMGADEPMLGGTEDVVLYYNTVDYAFGPPDGTQLDLSPGFHAVRFTNGCPENGPVVEQAADQVDIFLSDNDGYVPLVGCAPGM